ncbi:putative het domain-containing protein [Rosellinia necatrix]|uniref:Putative het domain-containing protein n=1 Tax=Rosellinia necatrix TaxID=77044 RepID=A0A1S7UKA9_ROSNE|nr:putative het domain-containing protein [Rosellinia necatrix]
MRLLNTTSYELRSDSLDYFRQHGYAILSHRWVGDEIKLDQLKDVVAEIRSGRAPCSTPQIDKIRGACRIARELRYSWIWIDSCCIDKTNAVELDESINSMFKWYGGASTCITYLSDVRLGAGSGVFESTERDGPSLWFSRGWTLQELLAPRELRFYDAGWRHLGTKAELVAELASITRIDPGYLTHARPFRAACVAAKMSWMAGRTTTRPEDVAYSMLGIFGVRMNTKYAEGAEAFMRLQHELLTAPNLPRDESLFAWRMPGPGAGAAHFGVSQEIPWQPDEWGLLAPSPEWFRDSGEVTLERAPAIERPLDGFKVAQGSLIAWVPAIGTTKSELAFQAAVTWSFVGWPLIPVAVKVLPAKRGKKDFEYPLKACVRDMQGNVAPVSIWLRPVSTGFQRIRCTEFVHGPSQRVLRRGKVEERKVFQPILRDEDDVYTPYAHEYMK